MIPVPFVLGVVGLAVLWWVASSFIMEAAAASSPGGGPPPGASPLEKKIWFSMSWLARVRYGGTSYQWNVERTARWLGISASDVRAVYPESQWDAASSSSSSAAIADGAARFGVDPSSIASAYRDLQPFEFPGAIFGGHGSHSEPQSPADWSIVSSSVLQALVSAGITPAVGGLDQAAWTAYVRSVVEAQ